MDRMNAPLTIEQLDRAKAWIRQEHRNITYGFDPMFPGNTCLTVSASKKWFSPRKKALAYGKTFVIGEYSVAPVTLVQPTQTPEIASCALCRAGKCRDAVDEGDYSTERCLSCVDLPRFVETVRAVAVAVPDDGLRSIDEDVRAASERESVRKERARAMYEENGYY